MPTGPGRATGDASSSSLEARVLDLLGPPLARSGLDVEDVEITRAGKRRVLRLAVDRDGGVGLDDVADVTREVSALLDESDVMGEAAYTLEVGSPGTDKPLTLPRHWRRNVGRLVKVHPVEGEPMTGRLLAAQDDEDGAATLEVSGHEHEVRYADVRRALVQIEFKRPATGEE